jgi:hypothetical protein
MSNSKSGQDSSSRVQRGAGPRHKLKKHNYRDRALPFLLKDFNHRCAYSMQHSSRSGLKSMEIDHFNPTLPARQRHQYSNLFLATRHCNNSKRENWPTAAQINRGMRFLNCCAELDYGEHIWENSNTHKLYGTSPAGRYHIRMCDLNAPHFVIERRDRAKLRDLLTTRLAIIRHLEKGVELYNLLVLLGSIADRMIPLIPSHKGNVT